jgi:uncharacterized membrane protein YfcA
MLDSYWRMLEPFQANLIYLLLIYLFAAVMSGLGGFGFSAMGAVTLYYLPATTALSMLMLLSLITQTLAIRKLWSEMSAQLRPWKRVDGVLPYCLGGIVGLPIGIHIMMAMGSRPLMLTIGVFLLAYSAYGLARPAKPLTLVSSSWRSALLVGAGGGLVGGIAAFPGSVLVVWNSFRNAPKEQCRALTAVFIWFMQLLGLVVLLSTQTQIFDTSLFVLFGTMLPVALLGTVAGVAVYRRTSQVNYRSITFAALGISGLGLLLKLLATQA